MVDVLSRRLLPDELSDNITQLHAPPELQSSTLFASAILVTGK